jgi:hypothetical protein
MANFPTVFFFATEAAVDTLNRYMAGGRFGDVRVVRRGVEDVSTCFRWRPRNAKYGTES